MSNWLSDLLDAIERHTQATQANTAAVRSLIDVAVTPPRPRGVVLEQLAEQLTEAKAITARLEALRISLVAPAPPTLGVCGVSGVAGMCRLPPGHSGGHVFSEEG